MALIVAAFIVILTEFTSNTASAALLVPIFISIAQALNMPPLGFAMIIGLGASCAFMMRLVHRLMQLCTPQALSNNLKWFVSVSLLI